MYKNKTFLAIIPARGGSKRLPQKNILNLNGKSLISYTIEACIRSNYIDNTVVTSDDEKILEIAKEYNTKIVKRPDELSTDTAKTFDAIKHAIKSSNKYDYIILLQPTSPLRNSNHIDEAIKSLDESNADAIISVCEAEHSPLWTNILPNDNSMINFIDRKISNKRSQDLDKYYRLNGAIYICKTDRLLKEESFFISDNIYAYHMDNYSSVDIDTITDFQFVDFLIKNKMEKI